MALRKAKTLLKAGAQVTAVSLDFTEELKKLAKRNKQIRLVVNSRFLTIRLPAGRQVRNDVQLAFACTSSHEENLKFTKACQKKGIWVNQADDLEKSDFLVPAALDQGPLQIAISTSGRSPFLARKLKQRIKAVLKKEDVRFLRWMGSRNARSRVIQALDRPSERRRFFKTLARPRFLRLFRSPKIARIEKIFERQLTNFQKKGNVKNR